MEMILIKNGNIYTPEPIGQKDILIAGEKIISIQDKINLPDSIPHRVIDASNLYITPGIIDGHVHYAGAGGEGGPSSRTPEMKLSQMLEGGTTTVVGLLGTDGFSRDVKNVLMKAKSLKEEGVTAFVMTGSYQVPVIATITGDYAQDIVLIDEVIGVGEIAISDHRCSVPTTNELAKITANARVAGMISGKSGIINIHMGDSDEHRFPVNAFQPLYEVCKTSMIPVKQFMPTHCNRNKYIFENAKEYVKFGGNADFTTSSYEYYPDLEVKSSKAVRIFLEEGLPIENITFTSDGNGSLPDFDENGNLTGLTMGALKSVLKEITDAVKDEKVPLEQAIKVGTSNPATLMKLNAKGFIKENYDADILMLDKDYNVYNVIARGQVMVYEGDIKVKGTFDK